MTATTTTVTATPSRRLWPAGGTLRALAWREWLQYRMGWLALIVVPLVLALLLAMFGEVQLGPGEQPPPRPQLPLLLALLPLVVVTVLAFAAMLIVSIVRSVNLARRDLPDRSAEFWLSLPVGHGTALAMPLAVHLLVAPALAAAAGWAGGHLVGAALVTRVLGSAGLAEVPWAAVEAGALSLLLRLVAGLPLALAWVSPLLLGTMLLLAVLKRTGWPVLAGVGITLLAARWFGLLSPLLDAIGALKMNALLALAGASRGRFSFGPNDGVESVQRLPELARQDFAAALAQLATPAFAAVLVISAALFVALMRWRRLGAAASD